MENNNQPINRPICQAGIKYIPAGTSRRTGKPYSEFWACISEECKFTWRPEKGSSSGGFQKAVQPDRTEEILETQRKTYAKLLDLEKEIREAIKIFGEK